MEKLKQAFAKARSRNNIEYIFDTLIHTTVFILSKQIPGEASAVRYIGRAPNKKRLCVTISETKERLQKFPGNVGIKIDGRALISTLPDSQEIAIVYDSGGDYITKEQLDWMRSKLK